MKEFHILLRTLCLTALLCLTATHALAYKIHDGSSWNIEATESLMGNDHILIVDNDATALFFIAGSGYAIIIMPGVKITVTNSCNIYDASAVYVFGELDIDHPYPNMNTNSGTVYVMKGGRLTGSFYYDNTTKTDQSLSDVSSLKKIPAKAPNPTQDGWKDYWIKEIGCSDDFYPICYYEDEDCTQEIGDIEAWKTGDGKIDRPASPKIGETTYELDDLSCYNGDLTFTDKEAYRVDYDFTVNGSITYSRTFKDTNWQALYVPFQMSYDEWKEGFEVAAINNFHEYTDANGATVKTELEVRLVKSGTLKPNTPYLIRAKVADESTPQTIELSTKQISKSAANSISCSSTEKKYTFTGTYKEMDGLQTMDCIFMSGGKLCKASNDTDILSPQRWYLTMENYFSMTEEGGASAKAFSFDIKVLDEEATGIGEISVSRTPMAEDSTAAYNLHGIRVGNGYRGIVIKNGKKFYKK